MFRNRALVIAAFLVAVVFASSIEARRNRGGSSRHSYPSHSGHHGSSGGSHSYPTSHGLSGAGAAHQPHQQHHTSVQNSAPAGHGGSHSYPNSPGGLSGGGGHSYPKSPGLSGNGGSHSYQNNPGGISSGGGHSYPNSPGLSGHGGQTSHNDHIGATNVHYNQHVYNPPPQIHYTPVHGAPPAHPYPVYHGQPPVYVHEIRDSGSRFSNLLTGLALYNLGRSASGFHGHHSSSSAPQQDAPGEMCTLRIEQDRNLERVKIPCYIVSTFTDVSDVKSALNVTTTSTTTPAPSVSVSAPEVTTAPLATTSKDLIVNNNTATNISENATALDGNSTLGNSSVNSTLGESSGNSTLGNSSLVVQNSTVVPTTTSAPTAEPIEAVKLKGEPVQLKKDARCFVEKKTKTSSSRKEIECGLLQQYAVQSIKRQPQRHHGNNDATTFTSHFILFSASIVACLVVY